MKAGSEPAQCVPAATGTGAAAGATAVGSLGVLSTVALEPVRLQPAPSAPLKLAPGARSKLSGTLTFAAFTARTTSVLPPPVSCAEKGMVSSARELSRLVQPAAGVNW